MHWVLRKDKFCFQTSMIFSILWKNCAMWTSKAVQLLVASAVYAGGLVRFRSVFVRHSPDRAKPGQARPDRTRPHLTRPTTPDQARTTPDQRRPGQARGVGRFVISLRFDMHAHTHSQAVRMSAVSIKLLLRFPSSALCLGGVQEFLQRPQALTWTSSKWVKAALLGWRLSS